MRSTDIERLLPAIFQSTLQRTDGPLPALLAVMEALQAPCEDVLGRVDSFFDPYRTPDRFVPYLAGWVDLDRLLAGSGGDPALGEDAHQGLPSGLGRLRNLIACGADLLRWRGTSTGLLLFLETATGTTGFVIDEQVVDDNGLVRPFHLRVGLPAEAEPYRALVDLIVRLEKPAHVTYELTAPPSS